MVAWATYKGCHHVHLLSCVVFRMACKDMGSNGCFDKLRGGHSGSGGSGMESSQLAGGELF